MHTGSLNSVSRGRSGQSLIQNKQSQTNLALLFGQYTVVVSVSRYSSFEVPDGRANLTLSLRSLS
jgi:hypothetical protein